MVPSTGSRVLVISLDGATFDVLTPLMTRGVLPALSALMERGCAAPLASVTPPTTAPAWMSFQTGTNPGKHGIVDFTAFDPEQHRAWLVTRRDVTRPAFWHWLGEAGRRVAVMNLPLTFPLGPVNGALIPGIFAPAGTAYPPDLMAELRRAVGDYPQPLMATAYFTLGPARFVAELTRRSRIRGEAARHLLARERWDFFLVHFQSVDSLQHMLWTRIEKVLDGSRDDVGLLEYFRSLDASLARLIEAAQAEHVFVVSDHGFGPMRRLVYVNEWLRREGWLTLRLPGLMVRTLSAVEGAARALDVFKIRRRIKLDRRQQFAALRKLTQDMLIDLDRSRAYAMYCSHAAHIYVNRTLGNGRAYARTCQRLTDSLRRLRDPMTGKPVFPTVYHRDEVFSGEAVPRLPDLMAVPEGGYHIATRIRGHRLFDTIRRGLCGNHRPHGVLIASGEGIAPRRRLTQASLLDLPPTLLYLLDVPVPTDLDGRVLLELFDPGFAPTRIARTAGEAPRNGTDGEAVFSPKEMEVIEGHLRGLGYL